MNAPELARPPSDAVAVATIRTADILPSSSNPRKRFDDAYIAELADSIKSHGLIQPITLRPIPLDRIFAFNKGRKAGDDSLPPSYEIVVGECRWRAAKLAGMIEIPAFWRELDDKQVLEIQVIENLQRRDVHALEEAEGYERLMKSHGYNADQIAAKIGKSRAYVYSRLKLTALAPKARDLFFDGKLTSSTALLIARIPGSTLQLKAAGEITKPGFNGDTMSYRAAFEFIQSNYMLDLDEATFRMDDADLVKKAGSCDACPKRCGNDLILFADIGDPNVCTDPACYNDKREANYLRLKALAESSGKEVVTGKAAHDMTYNGNFSLRAHNLARLDDTCHDDEDRRTYREILGPKAPPVTLVEDARQKVFFEAVDTRQLEAALKKAGVGKPEPRASKADREKQQQHDERIARHKAEGIYRKALQEVVLNELRAKVAGAALLADEFIGLLAAAWLRFDFTYNEELDAGRLERFGITLPVDPLPKGKDGYDDQVELEKVAAIMIAWPISRSLAFLFDIFTSEETNTGIYNFDPERDQPHILLALAKMTGIDAEALRESKPEPAKVQPKAAKVKAAKKPAAKADPAPPKTSTLNPVQAWPFPIGPKP